MDNLIQNCPLMARLAEASYLNDKEGQVEYKKLGFTNNIFISKGGAQAWVVSNKKTLVICFRGTEPDQFSDIKADLNVLPKKGKSGGYVHAGFQKELDKVWKKILPYVEQREDKDLYLTGHSLGGAMATLAASRLKGLVTCLYTFGSPRVGTSEFVKSFDTPHIRHVNNNDIVTRVPFAFLGYRHHGTLRYINHYGYVRKMTTWQRMKDAWRGRVAAFKKRMPFDGAYDHSMKYYVEYMEINNVGNS